MNPQTIEIENLKRKIFELETEIEYLSVSSSYKVLTRGGIDRRWKSVDKRNKSMLLFDIDHLHNLNEYYGYEEMNTRITKCLDCVRNSELLGLVFSGDEFVVIVSNDESVLVAERLSKEFAKYGITLTIAIGTIKSNNFDYHYRKLLELVSKQKQSNCRNSITKLKH